MNQSNDLSLKERSIYIVVAAICMVATFPGRTHGLGFITEFLLTDLRLDRTIYGYYNLWATLIGALFCIPIGSLLDRYGCRKILVFILACLGLSVLGMSAVENKVLFFILLVFTRGFGQSALSVASITLISKYFPKNKLGVAMGVYSVLTSIFFMVAFSGMGVALSSYSWRMSWAGLGIILLVVCIPMILFCVRSDKALSGKEEEIVDKSAGERGIAYREAVRSGIFWVFALSIAFFGLVSAGIGLYNEDILYERGFDTQMFYFLKVLPIPFALASNLLNGYLARRIKITYLLAFSLFFTGLVKLLFPFIQTAPQVYAYTIALSISGGGLTVLFFIVCAEVFGKRDVGRIQGAAQMISVFASAIGPVFFAYSKEWTESYTLAFFVSGGLTILFAFWALVVRVPLKPES
ncbi:MFS transporter [Parabacteroides distasonis]|uniref:MFS transporter n=1 Tax=Parabacteroides distasonis TaxID=823 RepID=UPI001898E406|nr:MFS transporter [Parabacteroides distasonis]MDB9049419.1 MFS transporter [Parabacteroides distasonis]MDB9059058.1 MFS transporter [Parabacteroides distasonis]MDB9087197.1 MFS transporter [Parabacteroides distasonis]